jgi:hypothetical protein
MLRFSDSWQFKSQSDGGGSQFSLKSSQSFDFSLEGSRQCRDGCHRHPGQGAGRAGRQFFKGDGKTLLTG